MVRLKLDDGCILQDDFPVGRPTRADLALCTEICPYLYVDGLCDTVKAAVHQEEMSSEFTSQTRETEYDERFIFSLKETDGSAPLTSASSKGGVSGEGNCKNNEPKGSQEEECPLTPNPLAMGRRTGSENWLWEGEPEPIKFTNSTTMSFKHFDVSSKTWVENTKHWVESTKKSRAPVINKMYLDAIEANYSHE